MNELMSKRGYTAMRLIMKAVDHIHPHVLRRVEAFGIKEGMTVVDYDCGRGRYTVEFARLIGEKGTVFAVDLVEEALAETRLKVSERGYDNVKTSCAIGYDSGLLDRVADITFAIDMIHYIQNPESFLTELGRITKDDGKLIVSGGHQTRAATKRTVSLSNVWELADDNAEFLVYVKQA